MGEVLEDLERRRFMSKVRNLLLDRLQGGGRTHQEVFGRPMGAPATTMSSRPYTAAETSAFNERNKNRALYGDRWNTKGGIGRQGLLRERLEQRKKKASAKAERQRWLDKLKQEKADREAEAHKYKMAGGITAPGGIGTVPGVGTGQQQTPKEGSGEAIIPPVQQQAPAQPAPFPGTREKQPWSQMPKGSGRITVPEETGGKTNMFGRKIAPAGTYGMNREGDIRFTPPTKRLPFGADYAVTPGGIDYEPDFEEPAPPVKTGAKKTRDGLGVSTPPEYKEFPQGKKTPGVTVAPQGQPRQFAREALSPIYRAGSYQDEIVKKFWEWLKKRKPQAEGIPKGVGKTSAGKWLFGR